MAELATIARPYAEALFQASGGDFTGVQAWLDRLAAVASDDQLQQFAANPKASSDQIFDLIAGVVGSQLTVHAQNFLRAVIDNNRVAVLPEVAAQFRSLANAKHGTSDAIVYSAYPVQGSALADLSAVLEKRFGRKLNVSVALDPELIGGVKVVVGDEVLDTSVKARLEQMKSMLVA